MEKHGVILDRITTGVAAGGVSLPLWEQGLVHVGSVAQSMVPILSALWLLVQIGGYIRKRWAA